MKCIALSGSIGVGKHWILSHLPSMINKHQIIKIEEPIPKWKPYLDYMYLTGSTEAHYQLQIEIYKHFKKIIDIEYPQNSLLVLERSPHETLEIFMKINKDKFKEEDYIYLIQLYSDLCEVYNNTFDIQFIGVTCNEAIQIERIQNRKQQTEPMTLLFMEYLNQLNLLYKEFLRDKKTIVNNEENTIEWVDFLVLE